MADKLITQELDLHLQKISTELDEKLLSHQKRMSNQFVASQEIMELSTRIDQRLTIMEQQVEEKANKVNVASALHRKANKIEVDVVVNQKADLKELHALFNSIKNKADQNQVEALQNAFNHLEHVMTENFQQFDQNSIFQLIQNYKYQADDSLNSLYQNLDAFKQQHDDQRIQLLSSLTKKVDINQFQELTVSINEQTIALKNEIYEDFLRFKKDFEDYKLQNHSMQTPQQEQQFNIDINQELANLNFRLTQFQELKANEIQETAVLIQTVTDQTKAELEQSLQSLQTQLQQLKGQLTISEKQITDRPSHYEIQGVLNECREDLQRNIAQFYQDLGGKVNVNDINNILSNKVDQQTLTSLLSQKVSLSEFELYKKHLDKLMNDMELKVDYAEFQSNQDNIKLIFDEIQRDISSRAPSEVITTMQELCCRNQSLSGTIDEMKLQLKQKCSSDDLDQIINEQAIINESLCSENIIARWTWKSGELKSGHQIPWEIQSMNTLPDNFIWEKDNTMILIISPGLYLVNLIWLFFKKETFNLSSCKQ